MGFLKPSVQNEHTDSPIQTSLAKGQNQGGEDVNTPPTRGKGSYVVTDASLQSYQEGDSNK